MCEFAIFDMTDNFTIHIRFVYAEQFYPLRFFVYDVEDETLLHVRIYHQGSDKTRISSIISMYIINSYSN